MLNCVGADVRLAWSRWLRTLGNVVYESEHEHGGHFAAHEEPEELVKDIRAFYGRGGPAFSVVSKRNGYA